MARTKLSAKGQMVLPKRIRDEMGWELGQELEVDREGDRVVVRAADADRQEWLARFSQLRGILKGTNALEEYAADRHAELEADDRWEREHRR